MKTLLAKEARALAVPTVAAMFVYVALAVVITLYSSRGSMTPTLIVGTLLMPLIALLLGSWAFSNNGGGQPVVEWESAWPLSRGRVWAAKVISYVVALGLIQTVCAGVPTLLMVSRQGMPLTMLPHLISGSWRYAGSPQFCFVLMVLAVSLMFSGAMRKSVAALSISALVVGLLSFFYLIAIGVWIPQAFGPKLGIAQGYMGSRAIVGCTLLMGAILLWSSLRGIKATLPLAYHRRLMMTVRHAGLLTLVALPLFAGIVLWSVAPNPKDLKAVGTPTVSPDGHWLAFLGGRYAGFPSPGYGVWIMSVDGTGLKCVGRGPVQSVRWLPDGGRLLISWMGAPLLPMMMRPTMKPNEPPSNRTWVIDCGNGAIERVPTVGDANAVMVAPGGRWALSGDKLSLLKPPYSIRDLGLAKDTPILGWSADGAMLFIGDPAFGPNDTITGIDAQSGAKTVLARPPALPLPAPPEQSTPASASPVATLPGMQALLQGATPQQMQALIAAQEIAKRQLQQEQAERASMQHMPIQNPGALHPIPAPEQNTWWVWGNRIVRRTAQGESTSSSGSPVTVAVNRTTGRCVTLPDEPLVKGFSPDGRYCWCTKHDTSGADFFSDAGPSVVVMDLATGRITATLSGEKVGRAAAEGGDRGSLQWSPDGSRVACGRDTIDIGLASTRSGQTHYVWSASADGTGFRVLYAAGEDQQTRSPMGGGHSCGVAGWTADGRVIVDDGGRAVVRVDPQTLQKMDLLRIKVPVMPTVGTLWR